MKRNIIWIITITMICLGLAGCGGSGTEGNEATEETTVTEEPVATEEATTTQTPQYTDFSYVKEISSQTGYGMDVNAVLLTPEGETIMRTQGELGEAAGWEVKLADEVSDIYVEPFGNGGFYAILMIKTDGTVSEVNASALINDKTVEVIDKLGGYEDVSSIESVQDVDAYGINVVMENGDKFPLDPYLK